MNTELDSQIADLDWDAFRYLTDEMSPSEQTAFEKRLEEDPSACEALARCMELSQAICQSTHASTVGQPTVAATAVSSRSEFISTLGRWGVMVAVAASLLATVSVMLSQTGRDSSRFVQQSKNNHELPAVSAEATQIVSIWAETAPLTQPAETTDEFLNAGADLAIPDWMLAAVEVANTPADRNHSSDNLKIREN